MSIYCISYICKIPKSRFDKQYLKKKKGREKRKTEWKADFKTESRYLMLC